jgi:hypothetical protein
MPLFLTMLSFVGMIAMFWVGAGSWFMGFTGRASTGRSMWWMLSATPRVRPSLVLAVFWHGRWSYRFGGLRRCHRVVTALVVMPILAPLWRRVRTT